MSAQGPSEQRSDALASSSGASGSYRAVFPRFPQAGADPDTRFHFGPRLEVPERMWETAGRARLGLQGPSVVADSIKASKAKGLSVHLVTLPNLLRQALKERCGCNQSPICYEVIASDGASEINIYVTPSQGKSALYWAVGIQDMGPN